MRLIASLIVATLGCGLAAPSSVAARLEVGPQQKLKLPSEAAAVAKDGDTIAIDPGTYFDCAIWSASHLTITGPAGAGTAAAVITDKTCQGKALFVIHGNDTIVQHLTFTRARVLDGNGAGIRQEGRNLTVEDSRFVNDQSGVLANDNPQSVITVTDSAFVDDGSCKPGCASALQIGHVARLRVVESQFSGTKRAHGILSAAARTELVGNTIQDGAEGTSSYLVDLPVGGIVVLDHNQLQKGPHTSNPRTGIMIGDGAALPETRVSATGNHFTNDTGRPVDFITNWTDASPDLDANTFSGDVTPASSRGAWVHRARVAAASVKDDAHAAAAGAYRLIKPIAAQLGLHR